MTVFGLYLLHDSAHVFFIRHAGQLQVDGNIFANVSDGRHGLRRGRKTEICPTESLPFRTLEMLCCDIRIKTRLQIVLIQANFKVLIKRRMLSRKLSSGEIKGQVRVTDFLQPSLPHVSALPLHHVEARQDDQLRLKLIQARHERLQRAHLPVGHVVGEDEAVGLRRPGWTPLFAWRWASTGEARTGRADAAEAAASWDLYLLCTRG